MKLAICLMTCGRPDLTNETLRTFAQFNGAILKGSTLLHADDETTEKNRWAASSRGFRTIHAPKERLGLMAGLEALVEAAADAKCDWLLWLENDWSSVKGLGDGDMPMLGRKMAAGAMPRGSVADDKPDDGLQCIRLYGEQKQQDGARPAGVKNMVSGEHILWTEWRHGWQTALAHWGGAPSVTWTDLLLPHCHAPTMKEMARRMGSLRTARPAENFLWHTGIEGTHDFRH